MWMFWTLAATCWVLLDRLEPLERHGQELRCGFARHDDRLTEPEPELAVLDKVRAPSVDEGDAASRDFQRSLFRLLDDCLLGRNDVRGRVDDERLVGVARAGRLLGLFDASVDLDRVAAFGVAAPAHARLPTFGVENPLEICHAPLRTGTRTLRLSASCESLAAMIRASESHVERRSRVR